MTGMQRIVEVNASQNREHIRLEPLQPPLQTELAPTQLASVTRTTEPARWWETTTARVGVDAFRDASSGTEDC
jgi:hypothetical protein